MMALRRLLWRSAFWLIIIWLILEFCSYIALRGVDVETIFIPRDDLMPFNPQTLWSFEPNSSFELDGIAYQIDEYGMRATVDSKEDDGILFVGDSSAFGLGVESNDSLSEQTARCSGLKARNAGVSGYSTYQIQQVLPSRMAQFQPRVVVLVVPWSDLMHASIDDVNRLKRARWVFSMQQLMKTPVIRSSWVIRFFVHTAQKNIKSNPINLDPNSVLHAKVRGQHRRVVSAEHVEYIKEIHHIVEQNDAELVIVQLPINRKYPSPPSSVIKAYREPVKRWSTEQNLPLVDGEKMYQIRSKTDPEEWFVDAVHPNAIGYQHLAKEICVVLASKID